MNPTRVAFLPAVAGALRSFTLATPADVPVRKLTHSAAVPTVATSSTDSLFWP